MEAIDIPPSPGPVRNSRAPAADRYRAGRWSGIGASLARSAFRESLHSPGRPAGCRSPLSGSRPSVSLMIFPMIRAN
jgi:hypothetical protein